MSESNINNIIVRQERLGEMIKYTCNITQSYIVFKDLGDTIQYHISELDWDNPKLVINLLSSAFYYITQETKYKKFRYYVLNEETHFINNENWIFINKDDYKTLLECYIDKAFVNLMSGFINE